MNTEATNNETHDPGATSGEAANALAAASLDEIAHQVKDCTDCPLSAGRTNAVP